MALNQEELNKFRIQKERLGSMLSETSEVINELNMTSASENLEKLSEKVNNDTFKIQVIGTFSNGKSTVINALLGEYVLPAYALPTTAVINEVKYGDKKEAILHFRNPLPEKLPESLSPKALSHMQKYNMENIPPLHIEYGEIEDYVVIPIGTDPTEMLLESPYEKVELFWPLPMLKEGVEIIDSPGLNESDTRTRVTMDYLIKADAILFVLIADRLCSKTELDFIENNLHEFGFTDPFFIVNRFDLIPDNQREGIMRFAKMKLSKYSTNEIFYISAQQALDGEVKGNASLYEKSQMGAFTKRLSEFLTKDKGKIKLSQPARELKRILNNEALYKIIPSQRLMLDSSLDDLKARYEKAKPQLESLKIKKEQIVSKINLKVERSKQEFRRAVYYNTLSTCEMILDWVDKYELKTKIGGFFTPNEEDVNKVVNEIAAHVQTKIEEQQNSWKKEVLIPLTQDKAQSIFESAETDLSNLLCEIDSIRLDISGNCATVPVEEVPIWERLGGAVAGFLGGGLGGAISGGINGLSKELVKSIAVNIGGLFLLSLLGCFNPFTAIALIAATVFAGLVGREEKTIKELKQKVTEELVNQISKNADAESDNIANNIAEQFSNVTSGISKALDLEINEVSTQVQGIISEMTKGQENIDSRKAVIDSCESRIKAISTNLDALTFELIEQK